MNAYSKTENITRPFDYQQSGTDLNRLENQSFHLGRNMRQFFLCDEFIAFKSQLDNIRHPPDDP